jgi:hypothetical protein
MSGRFRSILTNSLKYYGWMIGFTSLWAAGSFHYNTCRVKNKVALFNRKIFFANPKFYYSCLATKSILYAIIWPIYCYYLWRNNKSIRNLLYEEINKQNNTQNAVLNFVFPYTNTMLVIDKNISEYPSKPNISFRKLSD